jgi:hypothetical protein
LVSRNGFPPALIAESSGNYWTVNGRKKEVSGLGFPGTSREPPGNLRELTDPIAFEYVFDAA